MWVWELRPRFVGCGYWLLLLFVGCNSAADSSPTGPRAAYDGKYPYQVVTTCGMVTDIVRIVAGPHGRVTGLLGEGVDPHIYKPTRSDVKRLTEADIVIYSGLMLEGRMGDTFSRVGRSGKPVYAVTEGIDRSYLREPPEFAGHYDPHVWMDVAAWSECVGFVAQALAEFDPAHAEAYRAHAEAYRQELSALDAYVRDVIATIPREQRVLVTAHDAFGYFSRAYDIPVRSVQGISTESEPGVNDINELVEFIVSRRVPAVFVESSVSQRNIQAVIEGSQQRGWDVSIGGQLFSDAMGRPGAYEGTYVGMLDHNATTIARALGGEAPQRGMNDNLSD